MSPRSGSLLACSLALACARSLPPPGALAPLAPAQGETESSGQLLAEADAAWAKRAEPGAAGEAEALYLRAAHASPREPAAYLGAVRAQAFRLEREKDSEARKEIAASAVALGQRCEDAAPAAPLCDYALGSALGLQARERTATAHDALPRMVELLRRAEKNEPALDHAGPARLLALVFLRAPGWPLGPGDDEEGLKQAEAAAQLCPDFAPNQLALGEALRKSGREPEARAAYSRALALAASAAGKRDPDAESWSEGARAGLR